LKPASVPFLEDKRPLGQLKHTVSKAYNIKDFDSIRKHKLNISLNDMILTVISKSINQICKDIGKTDISNFLTIIPVGQHKLMQSAKDVVLDNQASSMFIEVPAVNEIIQDSKLVAKKLYKQLTNIPVLKAMFKLDAFLAEFIRREDLQDGSDNHLGHFDFITSNLPGPVEELYYGGCKLTTIFGFSGIMRHRLFIPLTSYNKQFRITCSVNECIDFDVKLFMKYFDDNLNELLSYSHLN
jgi:hypothetical protein